MHAGGRADQVEASCSLIFQGYGMLKHLEESNPSQIWRDREHEISIPLTGFGMTISFYVDKKWQDWDAEKVIRWYGNCILVDPTTNFGEYLSEASKIANKINRVTKRVRNDVLYVCTFAGAIFRSIDRNDEEAARQFLSDLIDILKCRYKETNLIWREWIDKMWDFLKMQDYA